MSTATTVQPNANSEIREFVLFVVEFYVSRVDLPVGNHIGGRSAVTGTTYRQFRQKRDHLVLETTSWSTISCMLSQVDVPIHVQPAMIAKISEAARAISASNGDLEILPLVVRITLISRGREDSLTASHDGNPEPANRAAIKSLETVDASSGSAEERCVICLDNIGASVRHARTPCKHVYHGECIVGWLRRSNSCPSCRFQLPEGS